MTRIWTPVKGPVMVEFGPGTTIVFYADKANAFGVTHPYPKEYNLCELVDAAPPLDMPDGEVLYVIRKALERHKRRMEELAGMGWYKDSTPTDNEIDRIDAALAWLDTMPWQAQPSEEDK
jgi:hypothetical protein